MMVPTFVLIFFIVILSEFSVTGFCDNSTKEMVSIKLYTDIKYFILPTSDEPVVTWMDIQKGIYPNTSHIESKLDVGDPITIFIYLKDPSNLYDIMVTDCWAFDDQNYETAKNKLHLTEEHSKKKRKLIDKWYKSDKIKGSSLKCFLYTDMPSFKFPDKDQVYMKCDIQLCFKSCDKFKKIVT
ncbi:uncharacterized protein LOC123010659 [Tribolium madens]|uniref:uncharacterized protein LOC123010659 n=1 Tax=Tribolium madens TaxID=41895 RepID=UPI001CF753B0|nr:uncharacterized protein LOC123010659 [Tribolium madens]